MRNISCMLCDCMISYIESINKNDIYSIISIVISVLGLFITCRIAKNVKDRENYEKKTIVLKQVREYCDYISCNHWQENFFGKSSKKISVGKEDLRIGISKCFSKKALTEFDKLLASCEAISQKDDCLCMWINSLRQDRPEEFDNFKNAITSYYSNNEVISDEEARFLFNDFSIQSVELPNEDDSRDFYSFLKIMEGQEKNFNERKLKFKDLLLKEIVSI